MAKVLSDWLPHDWRQGTCDPRIEGHLKDEVVEEVDARDRRWPGRHKNVLNWCRLSTGYAVGWNESPSVGWSFVLQAPGTGGDMKKSKSKSTKDVKDPMECKIKVETKGAVIVYRAHYHKRAGDVELVYIDCGSKYPRIGAYGIGTSEDAPGFFLEADEDTLHTSSSSKDTYVEFPDHVGWRIFAADVEKYTVSVALYKGNRS